MYNHFFPYESSHSPGGGSAVDGGGASSVHLSVVVQLPEVTPLVVHGVMPPGRSGARGVDRRKTRNIGYALKVVSCHARNIGRGQE